MGFKDWGERLQEKAKRIGGYQPNSNKIKEPVYPPSTDSGIGANQPKFVKPKANNIDLLKELLTSPRVEGITINIEKVGAVEETRINAKLKEIPLVLNIDESKVDKEFIEKLKKLQSEKTEIKPAY